MYDMSGFNYDITDVVHLLQLRVRHKNSSSMDVNCPFCGETKGKMNVNLQKNVFRCNRCDASGGMLELYGRLHGVSSAEANRQIREALGKGEYRTNYQVAPKKEPVVIFNAELADADVIDRTYQEMLSLLTLNDKHQEDLKKRGLTEEQIEIQRYRSVPLFGIKNMVQKLLESGQTVKGVPGFYEDQDGKWTINFSSKNSGILIPIQSPEGKIQGFQIRLDQVMEGRKYIWLSSVKFKNGVSSGSPVHVIGNLDAEQIYLTEGALKGTIAHYLSGDAGNGSFEKIMKNLPLLRKYEQATGNQISVASVVTSNNYQYYAESFQFLLDLGIKKLESGIDYYCAWSDEQLQELREQIEKVFGLYKAYIQKNQEVIFWNLWEQYLKSFLTPCPFYVCKAGLTTCYVTTDGGIYTCAELPEFKIGSVEEGLDVPRIREIIYLEDREDAMCQECQYLRHCKTRGCQMANYEIHQNVYKPIKVNCEVTKWMYHLIQTNLSEKQLEKLKQEYERRYLRHGK